MTMLLQEKQLLKDDRADGFSATVAESDSKHPASELRNLDALTSLRFFAALFVFLAHAHTSGLLHLVATKREMHAFSESVCFFFVLSGFVLAYRYRNMDGWKSVLQYFGNRLARIAPLYYLAGLTCLAVPCLLHFAVPSNVSLFAYLFALQDWFTTAEVGWFINPPAHSVSSETFFYFVFPLLFLFGRGRLAITACAVVVAVTLTYHFCGLSSNPKSMQPILGLAFFSGGVAVFELYKQFGNSLRQFAHKGLLPRCLFTVAEIAVLFFCADVALRVVNQDYWLMGRIFSGGPLFELATLAAFAACTFVFALEAGAVSRILKTRPLVALGHASYALFLTHYSIIILFNLLLKPHCPPHLQALLGWPCLAVSIVLSLFLRRHIEEPCRELLSELTFNWLNARSENLIRTKMPYSTIWRGLCIHLFLPAIVVLSILPCSQLLSHWSAVFNTKNQYQQWKSLKQPIVTGSANIQFGDEVELLGAKIVAEEGKTYLKTIWTLRQDVKQEVGFLATHLLDSRRQIVKNLDHPLLPSVSSTSKESIWQDVVEIPRLPNVRELGLALYDPKVKICAPVKGGNTDWNGRRLVIPLNETLK